MQPFALEQEYRRHIRPGVFDLSSSSPVPLTARDALRVAGIDPESLLDLPLTYERSGGSRELAAAVAVLYAGISPEDVLITAGASEAIRTVAISCVERGDTVAVQSPSYGALRETPADRGARIVDWRPDAGFAFDFASLRGPAFRNASTIFFNTPHGPSGALPHGTFDGPQRLIADEVYRPIELVPGTRSASVVDSNARAVSIGDLSKPLGLGGLRIGWIATRDRALLDRCRTALDYLSGSVSALSALVGLAALEHFDELLAPHLKRARRNLSAVAIMMEQHTDWLDWTPPQAGYTAFIRFRAGPAGTAFYERLAARGIFALDGSVYGESDYVRIGFGAEPAEFDLALAAFAEEVRRLPRAGSRCMAAKHDVIVIAKEPRAGFTKTRLAAEIGIDRAAEISGALLADSLDLARSAARTLHVAFTPETASAAFARLAPEAHRFAQPDGDLGDRLRHAFATAHASGASRPVLIGSDSPTLPSHLLGAAHDTLARHDIVLGPAEDGGYYLIGMNELHASIFEDIDWGTDRVLEQTLARAASAGLRVATLPYWYDVDTTAGLARVAQDPLLGNAMRGILAANTSAVGAAAS